VDFINRAWAQLSELFRSMTPAARVTTVLLLVVIVVSVAFLFNHQFSSTDCYLFGGEAASASELPAMTAAFGKANLNDFELEGNRIKVPRSKQAAYMAALADAGALPHNFLDSLKKPLESGGPFVDRAKRAELVKIGLEGELAQIIGKMNGIESASVLYDEQTEYGLNPRKIITASVQVKPTGSQSLSPDQVQAIRHVVGPGIGAAPESVSVVDLNNGRTYPGGTPGSNSDVSQDRYLNTKLKYEQEYTERIANALSFVKGALISVNVELHPELEETQSTNKVDPKAVPFDIQDSSKTQNATTSQPAGRPGVPGQGGVNAPASLAATGGSRNEDESTNHREKSMVGSEQRDIRRAGLTPKRVTVSVNVPSDYYDEIWQQRNPPAAGGAPSKPDAGAISQIETEVKSKITKSVLQQLPPPEDPAKDTALVDVETFQHLTVAELPKPSTTDHAMVWLTDHASSIGIGVLGLMSLMMVRSIVRSVPAPIASEGPAMELSAPAESEQADEENEQPAAPRLRRRRGKGGPSLRDELVEIVREDPDAAANILKSWIGSTN
jgi:flagellar M-ring protein FliF